LKNYITASKVQSCSQNSANPLAAEYSLPLTQAHVSASQLEYWYNSSWYASGSRSHDASL